jgi:SAM-dependent methyltransferase
MWRDLIDSPEDVPLLEHVPLLVPDPAAWAATYRDAALATLAEHGLATASAVGAVTELARRHEPIEPCRFGDDWIDVPPSIRLTGDIDPRSAGWERFLQEAEAPTLAELLFSMLPRTFGSVGTVGSLGTVIELGPGAGDLAALLAPRAERLVLGDLSLRSVLRAEAAAGLPAIGVVLDASALPFRDHVADLIVAANVIDLVDAPFELLLEAHRVLRPGAVLLLSTPDPQLGAVSGDPTVLSELVCEAGFAVEALHDGIPWARVHGRRTEVYSVQALLAVRGNEMREEKTR